MKIVLYYAVTSTGIGVLYADRPERDEHFGVWKGRTGGFFLETLAYLLEHGLRLPVITFKDDPVQLTLEVTI